MCGGYCGKNFQFWSEKLDWRELFFFPCDLKLKAQSWNLIWVSGEAVSGKYFISLSRTEPLPPHTRGMLCWYLTTFLNYTSCRTLALTDLVVLSAPFGCISIHGSDMHLPVWWIHFCCLVLSYLSFHPSDQKRFKETPQTVHAGAKAGRIWRVFRAAVSRSWIFSQLQIAHFAHFSISPSFACVCKHYFLW